MNGILVINKPASFTSFDVVAVIRGCSGQRKIGHTGTLDPNATGVLPLLLGNAAKAQELIANHDKEYIADFKPGITTDTLDIWGQVKSQTKTRLALEEVKAVLPEFTGEISQIPPMFSAVQQQGKRLYELARKGLVIERESRAVTIYSLRLVSFDEEQQTGRLFVACSKGTYIRTLIDDIGARLGTGAVMTALKRTKACGYTLEDSVTLEQAKELSVSGLLEEKLLPTESLFYHIPKLTVSDAQANRFYNGGRLDCQRTYLAKLQPKEGEIFRVKSRDGNFYGLGIVEKDYLKVYKHF